MLKNHHLQRAFSLMELLIVVGLIAVLFALGIPMLKGVRERSLTVKCVSNLKQTGAAILSYAGDRSGKLLPRHYSAATVPQERFWNSALLFHRYITDPNALYCPAFYPYNNKTPNIYNIYQDIGQCYGMRDWRTYNGTAYEFTEFKRLANIERPSEFFLIGDSYWKVTEAQGYSLVPGPSDGNAHIHLRHPGTRANLFYADGSVRSVDRADVAHINQTQAAYGRGTGFLVWPVGL